MISRDELYELVCSEPMRDLAVRLGTSGQALHRMCLAGNIPTFRRGGWTRTRGGKKVIRQPLPPAQAGDTLEFDLVLRPAEEVEAELASARAQRRRIVCNPLPRPHTFHPVARRVERTLKGERSFVSPGAVKGTLPEAMHDRAVLLVHTLLTRCEERGHAVRATEAAVLILVNSIAFSLEIYEPEKKVLDKRADPAVRRQWLAADPEERRYKGDAITQGRSPYNTWRNVGSGKLGFRFLVDLPDYRGIERRVGVWWDRDLKLAEAYIDTAVSAVEKMAVELGRQVAARKEYEKLRVVAEAEGRLRQNALELAEDWISAAHSVATRRARIEAARAELRLLEQSAEAASSHDIIEAFRANIDLAEAQLTPKLLETLRLLKAGLPAGPGWTTRPR